MTTAKVDLQGGATPLIIDDDRWAVINAALPAVLSPVRIAYAAAHVIMKPSYADVDHTPESPGRPEVIATHIDWDATMAFRTHLDLCGFGIAEAMDTAQRFELGWPAARELIERLGAIAPPHGFVAGASTDHLDEVCDIDDLINGVCHQVEVIASAGGIPVLLPMPWLSTHNADEETYVKVYTAIIDRCQGPVILHWLGEMFLASLAGYFPGESFDRIMDHDPAKVRACKISLLDADRERLIRSRISANDQLMLTGDDFHFADLIGDEGASTGAATLGPWTVPTGPFSHALLGIFAATSTPAGIALRALAAGRADAFHHIMAPCQDLGQSIFESPTHLYKCGIAWIAYLNGHQETFMLPNHLEESRDEAWYLKVADIANQAGALTDAPLAAERIQEMIDRRTARQT
jgi:hypothetical protein